jgi:single-strand DNA-binding protein
MAKDLNNLCLSGRLTKDAVLSYTSGGTAVLSFSIGNNTTKKGKDGNHTDLESYFDVVLYGKLGEAIQKYMLKGKHINLAGSIEQQHWQDKNGQNHSKDAIVASFVQLLSDGMQNQGGYQRQQPQQGYVQQQNYGDQPSQQYQGQQPETWTEDIPFSHR